MPPPRLKRSNTAGQVPASLADGEIAINQADGKLYYQTAAGGVAAFVSIPTAHKANHATGGSDALSPSDIGAFASSGGTVTGNVQVGSGALSGLRYLDVSNTDTASGSGSILRLISQNVAGNSTAAVNLVKYKNGQFSIWNSETNAAAFTSLTVGSTECLRVSSTVSNFTTSLTVGGTAVVVSSDSRLSDARTPLSHTHGNMSNAGAIGTTSGLPIVTTTAGVLTTGAFGTAAGSFCQGNDSRLSDARSPTSHTHGNITNAGAIGTTSGLPILTTTSGVLTTGAFGTAAGSFCQGNDARLSDARTPLAHTQAASTITDFATEAAKYGPVTSVNGLTGAVTISSGSSVSDGNKGDITVSGSGATWTINANAVITADIAGSAVTYAKIQNVSATDRLLGRSTAGAGVVEEITCTAFGRSVIAGADAAAVRTTLNAVSKAGDTISGALTCTGAITGQTGLNISGGRSLCRSNDSQYGVGSAYGIGGGYVYFGAVSAHSTPDAAISNAGGVTLMTLQNGGNVGIGTASPAVKLDVSGVARASSGIRFGTDTAVANTLSDYEEGTWTPAFVTGFSSVTVSAAVGQYIKIGKAVTAHVRLSASAFTGNGAQIGISLPFTASSTSIGGGFVHYSTAFAVGAVSAPTLQGPDGSSSTSNLIKANSEGFTASDLKAAPWTIGVTVLYTAD